MHRPHVRHGNELVAVFHDPHEAGEALDDLVRLDESDPDHAHHLHVAVSTGCHDCVPDPEGAMGRDLALAVAIVVPLSALANAALLWLIATIADLDDRMGLVLVGLASGVVLGLLFGGLLGMLLISRRATRAEALDAVPLTDEDTVVLAEFEAPRRRRDSDRFDQQVREILAGHHGAVVGV